METLRFEEMTYLAEVKEEMKLDPRPQAHTVAGCSFSQESYLPSSARDTVLMRKMPGLESFKPGRDLKTKNKQKQALPPSPISSP